MVEPTTVFVLGSLALFLIGTGVGWALTRLRGNYASPPVQIAIALLITIVWVIAVAAEILVPTYTVSMMLHGIMGAVVGYLFSEDGITINVGSE